MYRKEIKPEHQKLIKKIGERVKELRVAKGFSYIQMAKEIGISRNSYNLVELGNSYFNFSTLLLILDYHKISVSEFFKDL